MSIKTFIEIPIELFADGDPLDGEMYAEIATSKVHGAETLTLGPEDLLLLLGPAGVEALAHELIQDAIDTEQMRGDYLRDLQLDRDAERKALADEINP